MQLARARMREAAHMGSPDLAIASPLPREQVWMRVFDVAFALVVLTVTALIILVAMIAIRVDSRGPALFRQRRMGRNGETFELLKLRGMHVDARERHPELYDYVSVGPRETYYFHSAGDPRVTRVGRVLRRYSIDELPNFWNVLRGHMSVVGPRPEIPELAHLYGEDLAAPALGAAGSDEPLEGARTRRAVVRGDARARPRARRAPVVHGRPAHHRPHDQVGHRRNGCPLAPTGTLRRC